VKPYEEWPDEPAQRRALGRQLFAHHIQGLFRRGTSLANQLLSGHIPKRPDQADLALAAWAKRLTDEERQQIERVVAQAVHMTLFGLLVLLDGDIGGSSIPPNRVKYDLGMLVFPPDTEQPERISLTDPSELWGLHEALGEAAEGKPVTFPLEDSESEE